MPRALPPAGGRGVAIDASQGATPPPRATVAVVATGFAASLAERSVASVLAQSMPDVDLLLVGDGAAVARGDARRASAEPATLGAALQLALLEARAPYVLLLPAGAVLEPDAVARHLEAIEAYPPPAASLAREEGADGDGGDDEAALPPTRGRVLRRLLRGGAAPLGGALLRRDLALAVGFDASFTAAAGEDFWLRFLLRHGTRALDATLVRDARRAAASDDVRRAELGRALVRAFWSRPLDAFVAALSDGAWLDPGPARIELARELLASGIADARPLAHELLAEAARLGHDLPCDEPFRDLAACYPELARRGLPLEARTGGVSPAHAALDLCAPPTRPDEAAPPRPRSGRLVIALDATRAGESLLASAAELAAAGIDLLLVAGARVEQERLDAWAARGLRVEALQWDAAHEMEALLERCGVDALVAPPGTELARVAEEVGVARLERVPEASGASLAASLRDAVAAAASASAERHAAAASGALDALGAERAALDAWRVAGAGLAHPDSVTGRVLGRSFGDAQLDDLSAIAREAAMLAALAPRTKLRATRILDKLRLGHRARSSVRQLRAWLCGDAVPPTIPVEERELEAFLEPLQKQTAGWLWVVYATDPYSETRGQRSTWLTQELARRGYRILYLYWRWQPSDPIPLSGDPRVLQAPIDQLAAIQGRLFRLAAPGLRKVLLVEFPDRAMFERLSLFAAHGFLTVYDCIDEWAEFARVGQAYWYDAAVERKIVRSADVVVATHPLLAAELARIGEREVPLVPNGVKLESLARPAAPRPRSPVVIGYFGHLTGSWFDWDLVREAAARNLDWRFEIIGYGEPADLALPPNIVLPGMVPHERLSAATATWTVGIIPFREGRLTQAVDPVKLYEYLALGLPVVAVGMPHLRDVPGVEVCDRAGFDQAVRRALERPLDEARVAAFVEESRWERRVDALLALVEAADPARNVVKALAG